MSETRYRGRRAVSIQNDDLRITVLREGGHIAEIYDKAAHVNPLWTPPWPTIEPSEYDPVRSGLYGNGSDAKLLAAIMGHNLCLDIFGPPTDEEAAAGLTAHGEAPVVPFDVSVEGMTLVARAQLPIAALTFERTIQLHGRDVAIRETITNVSGDDRVVGWTQHVTLGPPFLEPGATQFRVSATRSKVFERSFGADDYLCPAAEFEWPTAPTLDGGSADLRLLNGMDRSSGYTAHLMDQARPEAFFIAFSPASEVALGYVWKSADFPWLGIWEENYSRQHRPWNGQTLARGMEFGVSPMPETRTEAIARGRMFDVPCLRLIAAGTSVEAEYRVFVRRARLIPESPD